MEKKAANGSEGLLRFLLILAPAFPRASVFHNECHREMGRSMGTDKCTPLLRLALGSLQGVPRPEILCWDKKKHFFAALPRPPPHPEGGCFCNRAEDFQ